MADEPTTTSKRKRSRRRPPMKLTIKIVSPEKKSKKHVKVESKKEENVVDFDDHDYESSKCDFCSKTFGDRGKLLTHVRRSHRSGSHTCVCHGREFKTRKSMLLHEEKTQEGTVGQRKHYRKYSHETLLKAYNAVKDKKMAIREASRKYGIPFTTLLDRIAGRLEMKPFTTTSGPPPLISREDEKKLCLHVQFMASIGYTYLRGSVTQLATELAIYKGVLEEGKVLSDNWYRKFVTRWPEMTKKRKGNTESTTTSSPEIVQKYFEEYIRILKSHNLLAKPENIYCMTVYEMNIQKLGISPKKKKMPSSKGSDVVSIILCCNAAGVSMAPFLVFSGVAFTEDLLEGCLPNTQARVSSSGEVDSSVFKDYFKNHLLKLLKTEGEASDGPVVVMYNGHLMHFEVERIEWARKHGVLLFALPPQTLHLKNSLDSEMKDLFQQFFKQEAKKFSKRHSGDPVTKYDVCSVVSRVFPQVFTTRILIRFFKNAGVYPISPEVVDPKVTYASVESFNDSVYDDLESTDAFLEVRLPFPNAANRILQRRNEVPIQSSPDKKQRIQSRQNQSSPGKPNSKKIQTSDQRIKDSENEWSQDNLVSTMYEHSYVHGIGSTDVNDGCVQVSVRPVISMANTGVDNVSHLATVVIDNNTINNVVDSSGHVNTVLDFESSAASAQDATGGVFDVVTGEVLGMEAVPVVETQVVSSVVEVGTSEEAPVVLELAAANPGESAPVELNARTIAEVGKVEESGGQRFSYAVDPATNIQYKIIFAE